MTPEELAKWHEAQITPVAHDSVQTTIFHRDAAATIRAAMGLLSDAGSIAGDTAVFCSNAGGWFENDPMPIASELGDRCNAFSAALNQKGPQDAG